MGTPLVQIQGVTKKYYGRSVLAGVSFDIAEGEVFGYIGPNGAGKTTTLKILVGLLTKYEGEVLVGGANVRKEREKTHALIGFMPQSCGFQNWRTVESALDSLGELSGVPDDIRKKRIPELLERFDLLDARKKKVKELSGGMTQKLGLIQALLHKPKLVVLDEPLEGLDPPSRSLLKDVIREHRRAGTTVLFSSHILSDVEDVADRIGILNRGQIATSGSMRDLTSALNLPLEVELELAKAPAELGYLTEHYDGSTIEERRPGVFRLSIPNGGDPDTIIHSIIERTLAREGRIRKIGLDLDALFGQYVRRANAKP